MQTDWTFCDGNGGLEPSRDSKPFRSWASLDDSARLSRRSALAWGSIGLLTALAGRPSALAQATFSSDSESRDLLVVIFLRGGADGLNIVVPYGDDAYHRNRPTLGLASPRSGASSGDMALDLDGFFGLHPTLAPLLPLYREGTMAVVHAVGSADQSRSHFEAMSAMERGLPDALSGAASGWLARYLTSTQAASDSPLRAVALGSMIPDSLRGGIGANAIRSIADFRLRGANASAERFKDLLKLVYAGGEDEASRAGRDTLSVLEALGRVAEQRQSGQSAFPDSDLGEGLRQVALLAKAGVGLEVACLDKGGWDTHVAQGTSSGWLAGLLDDLARSLAAFVRDMGARMGSTTVLVMSEFGRRVYENTGLGTDHGRAGAMFALGGGIQGGRVLAKWPGLEEHQLEPPGDLRVTTDYRQVLGEVLQRRMGYQELDTVFEGLRFQPVGLCA